MSGGVHDHATDSLDEGDDITPPLLASKGMCKLGQLADWTNMSVHQFTTDTPAKT